MTLPKAVQCCRMLQISLGIELWHLPGISMDCSNKSASAQVASAIESGVAQAAALATSMSADELEAKLQRRKQGMLASGSSACPGSPAGVHCLFSQEDSSMACASNGTQKHAHLTHRLL
jgi:hypothetical protein